VSASTDIPIPAKNCLLRMKKTSFQSEELRTIVISSGGGWGFEIANIAKIAGISKIESPPLIHPGLAPPKSSVSTVSSVSCFWLPPCRAVTPSWIFWFLAAPISTGHQYH
jgi:hypothetical protein